MRRATCLALATALIASCSPPDEETGSLASYVEASYGGDYDAFARAEWPRITDYAYYGDIGALRLLADNGFDMRQPAGARDGGINREGTLFQTAVGSREVEATRFFLERGFFEPEDARLLATGVTFGHVPMTQVALDYGDTDFLVCNNDACSQRQVGLAGAIEWSSEWTQRQGEWQEANAIIQAYMDDPANAAQVQRGIDSANARADARQLAWERDIAEQRANASGGGSNGGMALLGAVGGAVVGGAIGGAEGEVFNQTFSGVMSAADGADSGAGVAAGTVAAIGQGSGLLDTGTASAVGLFGQAVNGRQPRVNNAGNVTRPGPAQTEVTAPAQAATPGPATPYQFRCPHGSGPHTIDIPASALRQCTRAMEDLAYVMTCNLIDEMEGAQSSYRTECASEISLQ